MVEEIKVEAKVLTIEEIQLQMTDATAKKDWKLVSKLAQSLVKAEADAKGAEQKAKQEALAGMTTTVKSMFDKLVQFLTAGKEPDATEVDEFANALLELDGVELDKADGVWYSNDFSAESGHAITCRLMKGQAKEAKPKVAGEKATSTGGGKKYDISTEDLINEVGAESIFGDGTNATVKAGSAYSGKAVKSAYDESTDKNWRYGIRTALLKATNRM
jgi:hypothetical protein